MIVSIIIPVFNKEQTIKRAAESVLRQGLNPIEYELLLIDDGSTDNSAEICRRLADDYPDVIKFFSKRNEGVGPTRNFGILHSKGDYICFLDADDFLKDLGFRDFIDFFFSNKFDIISYYSTSIDDGHEEAALAKDIHGKVMYETTGHELLSKGECSNAVWNSWYRKDFLLSNSILFEPISYAEDLLFNINVYHANPKIRQTSSFIYVYVNYEGDGQLTKERDIHKTTSIVFDFVTIFERMGEISKNMRDNNQACDLETIFNKNLPMFASRLLSSSITVKQLFGIRKRLFKTGLNTKPGKSMKTTIAKYIINSGYAFPMLKLFYQKLFIPYILPKIDRETGMISFKNQKLPR